MNKATQIIELANTCTATSKIAQKSYFKPNQQQCPLRIVKRKKANSPSAKYGKYSCPSAILSLVEKSSQLKYSAMQTLVVMAT